MTEEDFKIHVLNNLPKEYESLIKKLIPDIDILKTEDLREELQSKYNRIMKYNNGNKNEEEQALTTNQPFKKFEGKRLQCGKQGHKAINCRLGQGKFNGNCHYCGKPGHCIEECRKKKQDEGQGQELANANTEEVVLMTTEHRFCATHAHCMEIGKHKRGICKAKEVTTIKETV